MAIESILLALVLIIGFYMAWNIGANDVANAMGTAVGSGALTLRRAVFIAALLEFGGAMLAGSHVSETVQRGIVQPEIFRDQPMDLVYGMIASLLAAGAWLQLASFYGWPVSTTHSIVGAVTGFGMLFGGIGAVNWDTLYQIVASWILSPLLGASLSYLIFNFLRRRIFYTEHPAAAAIRVAPLVVFLVLLTLTSLGLFKGLGTVQFQTGIFQSLGIASLVGLAGGGICFLLIRKLPDDTQPSSIVIHDPQVFYSLNKLRKHLARILSYTSGDMQHEAQRILEEVDALHERAHEKYNIHASVSDFDRVEGIFAKMQWLSACFMAFAHGANDVANAIGPLTGAVAVLTQGSIPEQAPIPVWILTLGGTGIVIGLATWGWRVIETIGKRITELTPSRGFSAEFGAATTILLASKLGLPISTTHTLVGSVLGVGLARGIGALNLALVRDIVISWVVTVPAGAAMAILFFYLLKAIFG